MKQLNPTKTALAFGLFFGGWHVVWSVLVLLGFAQTILNFIFWAHMVSSPLKTTGFSFMQSAVLISVTFVVGFVGGFIFAKLWNWLHK